MALVSTVDGTSQLGQYRRIRELRALPEAGEKAEIVNSALPRKIYHAGGVIRVRAPREPYRCDDLDCSACGRQEIAHYRCTACESKWSVPGVYVWSWQGKLHYHRADDLEGWVRTSVEHVTSHGDVSAGIVPIEQEIIPLREGQRPGRP